MSALRPIALSFQTKSPEWGISFLGVRQREISLFTRVLHALPLCVGSFRFLRGSEL
jgi:hypothetical protein